MMQDPDGLVAALGGHEKALAKRPSLVDGTPYRLVCRLNRGDILSRLGSDFLNGMKIFS